MSAERGHPAAPATCRGPGGGVRPAGAATTPGRLRRVEAVLVVAALVLGVLGVLGGMARVNAVHDARTRIAALTTGAADLYQSLADADAMATTGYVSGGLEPATVRARYDDDIQRAGRLLTGAAGLLPPGDPAIAAVSTVGEQLPVYTGLVENARALNRLGLPLGQSYLASASKLMQTTILPAVEQVRAAESAALAAAYRQGAAIPFAVLAIGLAVFIAMVDLALREWRRTNRVLNVGLTVAGFAVLVCLVWWAVARSPPTCGSAVRRATATRERRWTTPASPCCRRAATRASCWSPATAAAAPPTDAFSVQLERVVNNFGLLADAERADPELADRVAALRGAATAWAPPTARSAARRRRPVPAGRRLGRRPRAGHLRGAFDALDAALGRRDRRGAGRVRGRRRGGGGCAGRAAVDLGGVGAGRGGCRDRRDRTTGG